MTGAILDRSDVRELIIDHMGILAVRDGIAHYRTFCCRADVTTRSSGVICRACHEPMPDEMASAWMVSNREAWSRWSARWAAAEHHLTPTHGEVVGRIAARIAAREIDG